MIINSILVFLFQDVSNIKDVADEMELYFVVNKAFRQLFAKQEKLFTFYTYDHCNEVML